MAKWIMPEKGPLPAPVPGMEKQYENKEVHPNEKEQDESEETQKTT